MGREETLRKRPVIAALTALAAMWLAWLIGKEVRARHDDQTVEQEQDACREVIQCIGFHHPSEPEEYEPIEEPQLMLVHEVQKHVRQA